MEKYIISIIDFPVITLFYTPASCHFYQRQIISCIYDIITSVFVFAQSHVVTLVDCYPFRKRVVQPVILCYVCTWRDNFKSFQGVLHTKYLATDSMYKYNMFLTIEGREGKYVLYCLPIHTSMYQSLVTFSNRSSKYQRRNRKWRRVTFSVIKTS